MNCTSTTTLREQHAYLYNRMRDNRISQGERESLKRRMESIDAAIREREQATGRRVR